MREFLRGLTRIRGMPWLLCAAVLGLFLLLFSGSGEEHADQSYSAQLEHRIAQMTDTLPGVEDVSVLVTLEGAGGGIASVYGTKGSGEAHIVGIAVTCVGASDAKIRLEILHMLCAAFDLPSDRVWIGSKEAVHTP
ncbi:MAG: hypothetical protein IKZ09_01930 [Clostridia bacterium]|nr:hypothetical protein [Clostridia bacterium]